jgi:hypothetical protein
MRGDDMQLVCAHALCVNLCACACARVCKWAHAHTHTLYSVFEIPSTIHMETRVLVCVQAREKSTNKKVETHPSERAK